MTLAQAAIIVPSAFVFVGYIIRLERKVSAMATDISWIKKNIKSCQPPLEENTR